MIKNLDFISYSAGGREVPGQVVLDNPLVWSRQKVEGKEREGQVGWGRGTGSFDQSQFPL